MEDLNDLFELKKDISTPSSYIRAGIRKTKEEWIKLFPITGAFMPNEWFIDLSPEKATKYNIPIEHKIVDEVFSKNDLHSISYKEAAIQAIEKYKLYLQSKENFNKSIH